MRSAPPLQISVTRFGLWRSLVVLLSGCACVSMALWWWSQPLPAPHWVVAVAALGAMGTALVAATLWHTSPTMLRWDRQRWWLARGSGVEQFGELTVAIDLGAWLLLRFVAEGADAGLRWRRYAPTWVALQRPGLEAAWHELRCTLYAARPAAAHEAARLPAERRGA